LEALKYPAFFNEGESLIDAFTDLTDTPSSYTGQADKVVKVKTDETGLEFGDPSGFNLQINEEGETSISNVNRVEFANATVEDLGSGAVKVTPLGGGATPNLEAVLLEGSRKGIALEGDYTLTSADIATKLIADDGLGISADFEITIPQSVYPMAGSDNAFGSFLFINRSTFNCTIVADEGVFLNNIEEGTKVIPPNTMVIIDSIASNGQDDWQTFLIPTTLGGGGGDFVPLSGTTAGNPVTGDIVIADAVAFVPSADDAGSFYIGNLENGAINVGENGILSFVANDNPNFYGFSGQVDYSAIDPTNKLIYAQRWYVDNAVANLLPLTRQQFTYTSGAQTFTLTEEPSAIYLVFVNGQELNTDQFSIATNVLTIIDTLNSGDKVNILYSGQPIGLIPSYTKVETDALLDEKISKHVGATYTTNAIQTVTQAEYDALTPDASTLYFII
jgi:hypothetical protein